MDLDEEDFLSSNKPLQRKNTGTCLFCGSKINNSEKSREHVVADWLIQYLGITELNISQAIYNPFLDAITHERKPHSINSFKEGRVCSNCNGGWMSEIEVSVMNTLKSLISGDKELSNLSKVENDILARWAFKTAIVYNSASNFYKIVPVEHYEMLFKGLYPENLIITASMHYPNLAFYPSQTSTWSGANRTVSKEQLRLGTQDAYKIVLQFGRLILLVSYWPLKGWHYNLVKDRHILIHKPQCMDISYYERIPIPFTMNDSEGASAFLMLNLEVF